MTTKKLIARYNALATELGKPTLKTWKESKAKLEQRIAKLQVRIDTRVAQAEADNQAKASNLANRVADIAKAAKRVKASKASKKVDNAPQDALVTIADVARELGINPKVARAKLRRHGRTASDGRWPKMQRGSQVYHATVALLKGEEEVAND